MSGIRDYIRELIADTYEMTEDFDMHYMEDLVDSVMNDADFWEVFADTILEIVERELEGI